MKRLMILTAAAMMMAGALGCGRLFNRGSACTSYPVVPASPCEPDPCMGAAAAIMEGALPAPVYTP